MQYSKDGIPAQVINNIVWSTPNDIGTDIFLNAEDGVITERRRGGDVRDALSLRQLTTKEVHSFVKVVVTSNKTEVYRNLVHNRFRLSHEDLLYLACQGGAGDMAQIIMERKVRLGFIIVMTLYYSDNI